MPQARSGLEDSVGYSRAIHLRDHVRLTDKKTPIKGLTPGPTGKGVKEKAVAPNEWIYTQRGVRPSHFISPYNLCLFHTCVFRRFFFWW